MKKIKVKQFFNDERDVEVTLPTFRKSCGGTHYYKFNEDGTCVDVSANPRIELGIRILCNEVFPEIWFFEPESNEAEFKTVLSEVLSTLNAQIDEL